MKSAVEEAREIFERIRFFGKSKLREELLAEISFMLERTG